MPKLTPHPPYLAGLNIQAMRPGNEQQGLRSPADFDAFSRVIAQQMMAVHDHGDITRAPEYDGSTQIWLFHRANGRPTTHIADRFEIPPLTAAFTFTNNRVHITAVHEGQEEPVYQHRRYTQAVHYTAVADLALKQTGEVAGVAGIQVRQEMGHWRKGRSWEVGVKRFMPSHVALGATAAEVITKSHPTPRSSQWVRITAVR